MINYLNLLEKADFKFRLCGCSSVAHLNCKERMGNDMGSFIHCTHTDMLKYKYYPIRYISHCSAQIQQNLRLRPRAAA